MANQGSDRRTVLEMLAKAAAASQFPGFVRWAFGQQHEHSTSPAMPRAANYRPSYFSDSEYRTIEVLTDMIIPQDGSPGAQQAGVSEFIDFLAAHGEEQIQQPLRDGLKWLDSAATQAHAAVFTSLSREQQIEILKKAADRNKVTSDNQNAHEFFLLIRRYTVMGYYTSRVGLEELEYPGLRLYTQSPACPHTGDPEHRHLPAPRV